MDAKPRLIPSLLATANRIIVPRSANPVNGQKPEPTYRRKTQKNRLELGGTEEIYRRRCRWCRLWRIFFPWRNPRDRICVPPSEYRPDYLTGYSADRREWKAVQRNFPGPCLSTNTDMTTTTLPRTSGRVSLMPVVIDDGWPSLLAAQREKARLLDTESYISSRIADIDQKVRAIMDAKQERDPDLQMRFVMAQVAGTLHAVGMSSNPSKQTGWLVDPADVNWLYDLDKLFVLRDRLSPLSLLSPPPAL